MNLSFMQGFALADCAARLLATERPLHRGNGNGFMRSQPVAALRALWRSGDRELRQTVVARVHVWLGHDKARWQQAYQRVTGGAR